MVLTSLAVKILPVDFNILYTQDLIYSIDNALQSTPPE